MGPEPEKNEISEKNDAIGGRVNPLVRFAPVKHGVDCEKETHLGKGYLHGDEDDTPYNVDGCVYCGRCHTYIGKAI